jgi:hypothetical protein
VVAPLPTHVATPIRAATPISVLQHHGARIWDQRHIIARGETPTSIASGVQSYMRRYQGMPSTVGVSAIDLQAHNVGRPFAPGQTWTTPRWDANVNW